MNRTFGTDYETVNVDPKGGTAKKSGTAGRIEVISEPIDPVQFGFDISSSN